MSLTGLGKRIAEGLLTQTGGVGSLKGFSRRCRACRRVVSGTKRVPRNRERGHRRMPNGMCDSVGFKRGIVSFWRIMIDSLPLHHLEFVPRLKIRVILFGTALRGELVPGSPPWMFGKGVLCRR